MSKKASNPIPDGAVKPSPPPPPLKSGVSNPSDQSAKGVPNLIRSHDSFVKPISPNPEGKYGELHARDAGLMGYLPAKVLLDGDELLDCVVFDDIAGWADVYDRENGEIVVNATGDGPRLKRIYGSIQYFPKGSY